MILRRTPWLALLALAALAPACRSARTAHVVNEDRAECPVCLHDGDLACVEVTVEPGTPRLEYDGRTLYFCSDECRAEFERRPGRFCDCIR